MSDFLSVREVAERLDVHPMTIKRWCEKRKLTYYVIGQRKKFKEEDIEKYIEDNCREATHGTESTEKADPFRAG